MSSSSPSSSLSEPAIIEQVITEFFAKSLHIILESRSPFESSRNYAATAAADPVGSSSPSSTSSSSSTGRQRDKWFNLALRDCPAALENFDLWRQSNLDPLVIDVILARAAPAGCLVRTLSAKDPLWPSPQDDFISESSSNKIVERWVVQYDARKKSIDRDLNSSSAAGGGGGGGSSHTSEIPAQYRKTYKRTIILLRSLYATVRLLPAYRVFRAINSSGQIRPISLSHRISSFVEPFTRVEDAEMRQFNFAGVDTPCGRLSLSVSYIPALEDVSSQPSPPLSAELITDYVGSPTTDPLKKFTRWHSWSIDRVGMLPVSPSPSHAYSDTRGLRYTPPDHSDGELGARRIITGFDENWPSPPFSVSPTPSPPFHFRGGYTPNNLLRAESAPVSIPLPQLGMSGGLVNYGLPPSSSRKVTKTGVASHADASPDSKLRMKKESLRFLEYQSDSSLQKVLSIGREDIANISGVCSSPRIPFSRSSSRTFLDEFDDPEFAYPFAVDDVDLTYTGNRIKPDDAKGHERGNFDNRGSLLDKTSPDAAIGALVRMFKAAPPLQRDLSNSVSNMQASIDEIWNDRVLDDKGMGVRVEKLDNDAPNAEMAASGLFKSKTAADAFVELRHYKEMKELLLRQGGLRSLGATEH